MAIFKLSVLIAILLLLSGCMGTIPVKSAVKYLKANPIKFNFDIYTNGSKDVMANIKGTLQF